MDRYGFRPLYRSGDDISPSLFALPRSDLDWDALAVFIRLGYFVGNTTPFKGIRSVVPEPWITKHSAMSRGDAIDRYGTLFRTAVRKQLDGDIVLPLSGGCDSRHILFELLEAGVKPLTVTLRNWLPRPSEDLEIARQLAVRFGLEHVALGSIWPTVRAEWEKNRLTDFCADEHGWMLPLKPFMQGRAAFDGIAGDVLSAGLYLDQGMLSDMEAGDTASATERLLGSDDAWRAILDPALFKALDRDRAKALLQAELAKHVGAPNPVSSYLFWNRTRREIALFGAKILGDPRMPYIDDAVYDHLSSLPASYFLDKTFHTETIHRMFPQYAGIPYDGTKQTRAGRWLFRLASLKAEARRLSARSRWVRRRFLTLKTKAEDVSRVLYLMQLEQIVR